MPIFLDPLARQRSRRAQRVRRRRRAVLLAVIALGLLVAAISAANRSERVQPTDEVPAAAAPVAPPGAPSAATILAVPNELASAATMLWILLIAWTVGLASLALRGRRGGRLHGALLPSSSETRPEAHALRRSAPLKPVADRAPEPEDRWRQLGSETRRHREKPDADWDRQ